MEQTVTSYAAQHAFQHPQSVRNALLAAKLIEGNQANFTGKSFVCVSLTRFCPVGCKFCFFKSGPVFKQASHEDHFTPQGMDHFVTFCNNIDLGYLLVSGGGEPMMERKSVLRIIADVVSERIVLVTSAHWAKTPESAQRYLEEIVAALDGRTTPTSVTVRVSVDLEHAATLTLAPVKNLITLFAEKYGAHPQLDLQIHSIDHDPCIDTVVSELGERFTTTRTHVEQERISDGKNALKIVPRQEIITFNDLCVKVGYAKIFFSDLRVNLHNHEVMDRNIAVYQKDLYESEDGNSSIVTNKLGNPGLDYWVNYNGNVTTWGNQFLDNLFNLYDDETQDVITGSLSDPAALSFIEKGAPYRDAVVDEVNPIAVGRSKAVNIRDYTGALMFDEARTRLYYTVRSLQDFMAQGRIEAEKLACLPQELQDLLAASQQELAAAYNQEAFTIVEQVMEGEDQDPAYILDMLEWISLGHYQLSQEKIQKLIHHYNALAAPEARIQDLSSIQNTSKKMQIVRMTEHLTHIKPSMRVALLEAPLQAAA